MLKTLKKLIIFISLLPLLGANFVGGHQLQRSKNINNTFFEITIFESSLPQSQVGLVAEQAFRTIETIYKKSQALELALESSSLPLTESIKLNEDTFRILKESVRFSKISSGAYDLTAKPLHELWQQAKEEALPPSPEEIDLILQRVNYKSVVLDHSTEKLSIRQEDIALDLSAATLAHAIDRAANTLRKNGVGSAIIKGGESIRLLGRSPGNQGWRFGVEHPHDLDRHAAFMDLPANSSVVTITNYDNFFIYKDKRYPLTIDPRIGTPPQNEIVSVTIVAKNTLVAMLAARTFFVLGMEPGFDFLKHPDLSGVEAICLHDSTENKLLLGASRGAQSFLMDIHL